MQRLRKVVGFAEASARDGQSFVEILLTILFHTIVQEFKKNYQTSKRAIRRRVAAT